MNVLVKLFNFVLKLFGFCRLCDGLGSGAQQLVSKFGDTLLGGNVHVATAEELPVVPVAQLHHHMLADNTAAAGAMKAVNISVFGDDWRKPVLGLFGAQRYKPMTEGRHYSQPPPPPPPDVEIAQNFLYGVPPSDWVFPPLALPLTTCRATATSLCGTSQRKSTLACEACCAQHLVQLVSAGCIDTTIVPTPGNIRHAKPTCHQLTTNCFWAYFLGLS